MTSTCAARSYGPRSSSRPCATRSRAGTRFTTTAPLAFLNIKGHRTFPVGDGVRLDVIPVDLVCAGLIMAMAATIAGQNELVYQLGSSDSNPLYLERGVELLGLHKRRYYRNRTQGNATWNALQARMEPVSVDKQRFERTSAPLWKSAAEGLSSFIEKHTPKWGARACRASPPTRARASTGSRAAPRRPRSSSRSSCRSSTIAATCFAATTSGRYRRASHRPTPSR